MSEEPKVGGTVPVAGPVEAGKDYFWCACGRSAKQPFCDGSHAGTPFTPLKWTATETRRYAFCACKRTGTPPFCDGSHSKIKRAV
jgi:CDGSH iron-sulfur domain-containing protein 3